MPPESRAAGAGPSLTIPRNRAPCSYLRGREGGGGRRPAGTRLLLLRRVVQQNFAALVELPHGGRGGGPAASRQRAGRGGSERCSAAPAGPAALGRAGTPPGAPGRQGGREAGREELPGGAGSPPLATASPTGLRMQLGTGGPRRGAGRAGQGRVGSHRLPALLTCRRAPPEPPPLPCLRGGGTARGGCPASPRQQRRARRQHPRSARCLPQARGDCRR